MNEIQGPPRDVVGYNGRPPKVVWPNNARVAVSLVVNFEEGSERAVGDGDPDGELGAAEVQLTSRPPGKRDLAMETMYEYGTRAGFWRLLDILDNHNVPATFFACAVALERNRDAARAITVRGHEPCSHGYRWEDVTLLTREEEREHIRLAIKSIEETTGQRPLGWYCRYGPSVHTRELVVEEGGFVYDSDSYNDDLPYWTEVNGTRHLVVPYTLDANDIKFGRGGFGSPRDFEDYLIYGFDRLYKEGITAPKMMSIGLHMRLVGRPARAEALDRFLTHARSFPNVWFARRIDIARWWQEHYA
jgi:peptidoglycan/xylan/chitin deacetylase (PgdA/CDA1 family)